MDIMELLPYLIIGITSISNFIGTCMTYKRTGKISSNINSNINGNVVREDIVSLIEYHKKTANELEKKLKGE